MAVDIDDGNVVPEGKVHLAGIYQKLGADARAAAVAVAAQKGLLR